jgi:glucose-1-phosphate cytidylyltransferase
MTTLSSHRNTPVGEIPVVILAGGLGTRLREETERVPKPLVQIGERPIIWHIMKLYGHHGFRRFILCLGYKSHVLKDYFLRYREQLSDITVQLSGNHEIRYLNTPADEDWEITLAETGLLTGTGGRVRKVRDYIDTDTFMLTYGDGIGAVDLTGLLHYHRQHDRIGTVTGVHPTSRYGELSLDGGNLVEEFNEKPTTPKDYVSGGFFVFQREFLEYFGDEPELLLESEPLRNLSRDKELMLFPHTGFWMGMDTYREFDSLNKLWATGEAPWKVWSD